MSRLRDSMLAAMLAACAFAAHAQNKNPFPGIGREATPAEVNAWNIDVRPDFQGLPKGSGSVDQGQTIWEGKCSSCHGVFGESNEFFQPLVGGTSADDTKTGHVAALKRPEVERTMLMKLPTVSTLWDFIHRAMPWNAPKSLTTDEVYAVTAYLLSLGNVVPDNFVLSDGNIAEVQQRLPNRNGMTTRHAMWAGNELGGASRPDVLANACMKNCAVDVKIASTLPDHARNSHGNLAEQVRLVGQTLGADTTQPEPTRLGERPAVAAPAVGATTDTGPVPMALLQKNGCLACHSVTSKLVGPAYVDVAKKYAGQVDYLIGKIRGGSSGVWGDIPMPPQVIEQNGLAKIANWLASGAAH